MCSSDLFPSHDTKLSLEFYDNADNKKGIVLPWTSTVNNQPVSYNASTGAGYRGMQGTIENGTIIFDLSDKNVKYRKDGSWFNLTNVTYPVTVKNPDNTTTTFTANNAVDSSIQDNKKKTKMPELLSEPMQIPIPPMGFSFLRIPTVRWFCQKFPALILISSIPLRV